ncbi:MAG: hypothetical protein DCF32_22400 [Leptolyngbya sp.]|nr:MAG: hypothetical protein DCF32_22400 [Leptolyngbya sp.]
MAVSQSLWVWLRYGRRWLYPWLVLAQAGWQWVLLCGAERASTGQSLKRQRAAIRWMATLVKIDGVKLTTFLNDLIW